MALDKGYQKGRRFPNNSLQTVEPAKAELEKISIKTLKSKKQKKK